MGNFFETLGKISRKSKKAEWDKHPIKNVPPQSTECKGVLQASPFVMDEDEAESRSVTKVEYDQRPLTQ